MTYPLHIDGMRTDTKCATIFIDPINYVNGWIKFTFIDEFQQLR